jgi:hypothetical protein
MPPCRVCGAPARRHNSVCAACGAELQRYRDIRAAGGAGPIRIRRYGSVPAPEEVEEGASPPSGFDDAGPPRRSRLRAVLLLLFGTAAVAGVVLGCVRLLR